MMMTVTATVAMLGLFTLALMLRPIVGDETAVVEWQQVLPHLDTFASYEDMQRYFDHRNQRSLRHLDNPADDSYVEAFNRHNEQEVQRSKRSANDKTLPKMPTLIRFEMADAVEPSDEVKDLIRHYRSRELQSHTKGQDSKSKAIVKRTPANTARNQRTTATKAKYSATKHSTRTRRATVQHQQQQPANFKVQFIPFDESDAREPDEQTKLIIKRMRALDIERLSRDLPAPDLPSITHVATSTTKKPLFKRSKYQKLRKSKRSKRDAPEMIKFELADAKDPDPSQKTFMKSTIKQTRESKDLKVAADQLAPDVKEDDQKSQASKRYFSYKENPIKVKKSITPLPHDVQHIISHLIKGNGHGKAFVKYIPAQQMDYNKLKLAYQAPKGGQAVYGHGGNAYVKYGPGPAKAEQVQVQIHSVPVVEKIRYVYTPVAVGEGGGQGGQGGGGGHGGQEGGYGGQEAAYGGHAGAYGGGQDAGHGGQAYGGQEGGHVYVAAAAYGGQDGGHGSQGGGHGGSAEEYGGISHGYVGLGAHAAPAAGGYGGHGGYAGDHAAAAISHPIVVADGAAAQKPAEIHQAYAAELADDGNGKAEANEAIKSVAAPQFKASKAEASLGGEVSVAPTVEQYSQAYTNNIQTQDFKLKLYSPEALLAKAQLEAKLKIEAINAENLKVAAQYGHGGGGGGHGGGGGGGGHGGGGAYVGGGGHGGGGGGGHGGGGGGAYVGGGHGGGGAYVGGGGHGGGGGGGHGGGGGGAYVGGGHGGGGAYVGGGGHGGGGGGGGGGGHVGVGAYAGGGGHGGIGGYGGHGGAGAYVGGHGGAGGGGGGHGDNANGPVIKIEYHAAPDSLKENYKEMPEFKHLSSLVGKSPEDQIHGLTYLLAKEMQTRLHGGGGGGGGEGGGARPQDNKAPVLFHPEESGEAAGGGGVSAESGGHYQNAIQQPGKLIGMAKSKQYIPVIEQYPVDEHKAAAAALAIAGKDGGGGGGGGGKGGAGGKYAAPHSYMSYGLSPNYKGFSLPAVQQKGAAAGAGGYLGAGGAGKSLHEAGYDSAIQKMQSYASKYAFGYRIRDFNTGNDFGHKQNRDLNGVTRGQYHILLPDGRIQNVIYHADDTGFHADVSFEGTERPAVI